MMRPATPNPTELDQPTRRVLLIGWDAADWQFAGPLMQAGRMPHLATLVERGTSGNLASMQPMLSPILWNTIATGRLADAHGVHGFTEPLPDGTGVRPVSSRSRRCKALWNMLSQSGMTSNVVGWYASHPAEPIAGTMVSNLFEQPKGRLEEEWVVPEGAVHPPKDLAALADLRIHPGEIEAETLASFVPDLQAAAEKYPEKLRELRVLLAQTASIHNVATHLLENTSRDLTAVYYEGIDRFGHAFMHLHPPCMEHVDADEFELFQHVMTGCYLFHDMMLGRLLELAGDEVAVILISDHGYHHGSLRPDPREGKSDPTAWHRPLGLVAAAGPNIKSNEHLYGASLVDVCPTVLSLLGLPVGMDMPGRPWLEAMDHPPETPRTVSWELLKGEDGRLSEDASEDPVAAKAALQQLVDLGYIEAPSQDTAELIAKTHLSNTLNLATVLRTSQRPQRALDVLDALPADDAATSDVILQKALCLLALNQADRCRALLATLENDHGVARLHMIRGVLAYHEGQPELALQYFQDAIDEQPNSATIRIHISDVLISLEKHEEAEPHLRAALAIDPDHAGAFHGLSQIARHAGHLDDAIDYALEAVARRHHFPRAHFHLAEALFDVGKLAEARDALTLATTQASHYIQAHRLLARVYDALEDVSSAAEQRRLAQEAELRTKLSSSLQTAAKAPTLNG